MSERFFSAQSAMDYEKVRNRAFFNKVWATLRRRQGDQRLLSFDDVKRMVGCSHETYLGMHTVPIEAIVGSVGRYRDFDREFLPTQGATKERWRRVDEAYYEDVVLPPVQLYKVGDIYFVKDGNHRVSVAKEQGVTFIDAEVIECRTRVPLWTNMHQDDLSRINEYVQFLEWSRLDQLRPEQSIRFTLSGGYAVLQEHIEVHQYYLSRERRTDVSLGDAVGSWYDNVYLPVVEEIRAEEILKRFPQRTEADLYLWIMDHLYFLREKEGKQVPLEEAAEDFAERYAQRSLLQTLWQGLRELTPGSAHGDDAAPGKGSR